MNNTIRLNKFNKFGGSKKKKGGMPGRGNRKVKNPRKVKSQVKEASTQSTLLSELGTRDISDRINLDYPDTKSPVPSPRVNLLKESDAYRSIYVINKNLPENDQRNEVEALLSYSIKCPKKDGTPGKRLLYLVNACENLLKEFNLEGTFYNEFLPKKSVSQKDFLDAKNTLLNVKNEEVEEEEKKSGKESRGWWVSNSNKKIALCALVDFILDEILPKNVKDSPTEASIIASLWSIIMVKSISDISQMGQLLNYIKDSPVEKSSEKTKTIYDIINKDIKSVFVSSDKICAGVSSILIRSVPFLSLTLCTRKSSVGHKTTQNILVLKGEIAALMVCLQIFNTKFNSKFYKYLFGSIFDDKSKDSLDLKYMMAKLAYYKNEYESKIQFTIEAEFNRLFFKKREINNITIYKEDAFKNLSNFIYEIYKVLISKTHSKQGNNLDLLNKISNEIFNQKYKPFICQKWTYYVATDVFRLLYPQSQSKTNNNNFKNNISFGEILAATIDGTYGHDFAGLDCIQKLGEKFMNISASNYRGNKNDKMYKDFILDSESKKDENEAIKKCLEQSKCVTIDQIGDNFKINFNPDTNYLTGEISICNPQYWHFFDSLFSLKPLILAVDFTAGLQPYSTVASSEVVVKEEAIESEELKNPIKPNQLQYIVSEQIKENGTGFELIGVNALFDGAASYGIYPKYVVNAADGKFIPYISETVINYTYTNGKSKKNETTKIQVKFVTTSPLTALQLEERYKTSLIPSTFTPLEGVLNALLTFYRNDKQKLNEVLNTLDNKNNIYSDKFSKLWAELLNFKVKVEEFNNDKELKVKLDKKDLQNFIKGCKVYITNTFTKEKLQIPYGLREINKILNSSDNKANVEFFNNVFNNCIALIIKNLVDLNTTVQDKQHILSMFATGISYAKNNTPNKLQIFGKPEIVNEIDAINGTPVEKIDNVLAYFFNTKIPDSSEGKTSKSSIAEPFLEKGKGEQFLSPGELSDLAKGKSNSTGYGGILPDNVYKKEPPIKEKINFNESEEKIGTPFPQSNTPNSPPPNTKLPVDTTRQGLGKTLNIDSQSTVTSSGMDIEGGKKLKKTRRQRSKKNKLTKRKH